MAAENSPSNLPETYSCTRSRSSDSGLLVIPVAGPAGTPPKVVRVHGGLELETVDFSASSIGAYPKVPHPDINDPNLLRLGGSQSVPLPMIQPQGPHRWTIAGSYSYVHRQMVGLASPLPVGQMPFDPTSDALSNTIPADCFSQAILGSFSPPKVQPGQTQLGSPFIPRP